MFGIACNSVTLPEATPGKSEVYWYKNGLLIQQSSIDATKTYHTRGVIFLLLHTQRALPATLSSSIQTGCSRKNIRITVQQVYIN